MGEGHRLLDARAVFLQCDALLGEVVLQQRQRQRQNRQYAHEDKPFALIHPNDRHDDHGEHQRHENAAHHDGGDLVENGQTAALRDIAGGQRHHQVVAHVKDGIGEGVEQIITDHDPDDLHTLAAAWYGKEQNARDRQQRCGKQQPRPCFTGGGVGTVNDIAHNHIGNSVDDFGNDGEDHQKPPAPNVCQLQDIRVIDIQVGCEHGVEQQRTRRAEQIA